MKRVFWIVMVLLLVICMVVPCYATETNLETCETIEDVATEEEFAVSTDWLTDLWSSIMAHKDDIMAGILLVAAALYKAGSSIIKKKILPDMKKQNNAQNETVLKMAQAAGQITQTNKVQFDMVINEVKSILSAGSEREKVLLDALALSDKTKEEYKALCEKYALQNKKIETALIAQEQMTYETLMSAKLTDVRKEEIEKQHLKLMGIYKALVNATSEEVTNEDVAA